MVRATNRSRSLACVTAERARIVDTTAAPIRGSDTEGHRSGRGRKGDARCLGENADPWLGEPRILGAELKHFLSMSNYNRITMAPLER
jgi:hypothetical protein